MSTARANRSDTTTCLISLDDIDEHTKTGNKFADAQKGSDDVTGWGF
jgi:hypothetical protein